MRASRSFEVPEALDGLLASRASAESVTKADLVRRFVDAFVSLDRADVRLTEGPERRVLRRYYLDPTSDRALAKIAKEHAASKGKVFRAALRRGLGIDVSTKAPRSRVDVTQFKAELLLNLSAEVEPAVFKAVVLVADAMSESFPDSVARQQLRSEGGEATARLDEAFSAISKQPNVVATAGHVRFASDPELVV